ncbi:tetratricopeptide repeat protein [Leptospira sp. 96542]|nr:tetratricopeptide repeat protein [Leptospira sp. 96542]
MKLSLRNWLTFCILFTLPIWGQAGFDEGKYPTVTKALRAALLPDKKSIRLDWDPPKGEGELILARSNSIIDSPDKLYIADSLGRYKSNNTRSYFDYNLKPGTYYYAAVLVSDVRKREVKLFANQNYTVIPVVVDDENSTPSLTTNPDFPAFPADTNLQTMVGGVSNLSANIENKYVRLNWSAPAFASAGRTIYTVYRSSSPLTSLPLIQKATKLAELTHPSLTFLDQDLDKSQTLYYGVSVKQVGGEEVLPLEDKKSSIRVFYIKENRNKNAEVFVENTPQKETQKEAKQADPAGTMHVQGIGYERVGKGVVISWLPPEGADESTIYTLYASIKPLDKGASSFAQGTVVKVATITHPKTNFFIKELKEIDELYFGITAKSNSISEDFLLKENISYLKYDFGKDSLVPEETNVATDSKIPEETKQSNTDDKNEHIVTPAETKIVDPKTEVASDLKVETESTVNYDLGQTDLNRIIKETVMKKKYETAVYRLEEYLKHESNGYLRGKAMFFLGVSALKTGDSKKALRCFLKRETKSYSPTRVEFWTNQTLNGVGRGNL